MTQATALPCLLFDIDGTLTDTDDHHFEAIIQVFAPFGVALDLETFRSRIIGRPNRTIFAEFLPDLPEDTRNQLADRKEEAFRATANGRIAPMPGLLDLLDWSDAQGLAMGVVTNAPRPNADAILGGLGLAARFRTLVIGEELAHGKPHPLPYLTGLAQLGACAGKSVAFEDSPAGVTSAAAAGMAVVGVLTSQPAATLMAAGAGLTVASFADSRLHDFILARTTPR